MKLARKFEFTRESISGIPVPVDKDRIDYFDANLTGLQLRVSKAGTKKFRLVVKKDGKNVYVSIGAFGDLPLSVVRQKAKQKKAQILLGQHEPKKSTLAQPNVKDVFQAYLEHHQFNPGSLKADRHKVQRQFDRFVFSNSRFCRLDVTELDVNDCVPLVRVALESGNTTANNLLRNCKAALNWGMKAPTNAKAPAEFSHWKIRFNPFTLIPLQESSNEQDDRFLTVEELATAYGLLETVPEPAREILRFYFLSAGIRLRQLARLSWDDVDVKEQTMRLRDFKGRRAQPRVYTLPLTDKMLETLHKASPGQFPLSTGQASLDAQHARYVTAISRQMEEKGSRPFTAKHIRKTGWSLIRGIPLEAKRYWLSDDINTVAHRHYDFYDHRTEIKHGMTLWQAWCEGGQE